MTNTYAKAYTEVLEILKYFPHEEYLKIPKEKILFYKNNMDKDYKFTINPNIELSEQKISNEANAVLISLFRDYFATEKQKTILKNSLFQNELIKEKKKSEKYNTDIFHNINSNSTISNSYLPTEVKREKLWNRIIKRIKSFFRIDI